MSADRLEGNVWGWTDHTRNARHIYALIAYNRCAPLRSCEALASSRLTSNTFSSACPRKIGKKERTAPVGTIALSLAARMHT